MNQRKAKQKRREELIILNAESMEEIDFDNQGEMQKAFESGFLLVISRDDLKRWNISRG